MIALPIPIRPAPSGDARPDFRLRRPEALDNLATRIPDDVDVSRLRIVWWYNERPPDGKEAGHKEHVPCSCCKQRKLHWIGCVVQLPDGRYALIGHTCGIRELGPTYQLMQNAFKAEVDLSHGLARIDRIKLHITAAAAELEALATSQAVLGFDRYFHDLGHRFGHLGRHLVATVRSNQGQLSTLEEVHDPEATEHAARKAAKAMVDGTDKIDLFGAIDAAATIEDRRIAVARWRKFVERQPKLYKRQPLTMGECAAWRVLIANQRSTPAKLVAEATELFKPHALHIVGRASHEWSNILLGKLNKDLKAAFDQIDAASKLVADLAAFCAGTNIHRVAAWAKQVEAIERRIGQIIVADGVALCDAQASTRLELPQTCRWPELPELSFVPPPNHRSIPPRESRNRAVLQLSSKPEGAI